TSEVVVDINGRNEPASPGTGSGGSTGGGSTPTAGVIEVSSVAGLIQALSGNVSGYTIELAPGDYGTINLNGYNFSSPVIITSADPNSPAQFESISVRNSSNIEFNSLDVISDDAPSGAWGEYLITIDSSSDIVISDSFVSTSRSTGMAEGFAGLIVKNSNNITVEDSEFTNMSGGAGFVSSNGITILNNEFHDIRADGVAFSGVQGVEIDGNYFHDFYHTAGDHSDYVQFWVTAGLQSNEDITITNNLMTQGNGYDTQGIFMTATSGQPMQNVVIENNIIYQSGYHGISVTNANGVEINDNTVISPPDSASGFSVWIAMTGVTNGVLENNISNSFVLNGSSVSQSGNVVAYDSTVPWNAGSYPTYSYDQIFANDMNIKSVNADDFALSSGFNVGAAIENLLGDVIDGTANAFATSDGTFEGTVGDDYIGGTSAAEEIFGFDGDDELFGFGGADVIVGGDGADTLTGGSERDTFVYTEISDSGIGSGNRDVIMDFDATNGDMLSFEGFATDGFDYSFNDSTDVLSVDLDGDFTIDMEIQLIGVSASDLDSSDFLV
ncbi:MAG: right-handed parallel beta-helix repeat-containing protein, partial [Haliea sp.]